MRTRLAAGLVALAVLAIPTVGRPACGDLTAPCETGACCTVDCEIAPATTLCRKTAGDCDVEENCDGTTADCPPDALQPASVTCRAAAGDCDLAEQCTGSDVACPPDVKSSAVCRPAAGVCDTAESCDGLHDDCPADAKSTALCRAGADACDVAESCDGVGDDCPHNTFAPASVTCRGAGGVCDLAEQCTGSTSACPPDAKSTATCRAAVDVCDLAEQCDGVGNDCPPDALAPVTLTCRAPAGVCDAAEQCTGSTSACPPDVKLTTVCRPLAGVCDVAESCNGTNADCPRDEFQPATVTCRAAAGVCDAAEHCTGAGPGCPGDARRPEFAPCDDQNLCTTADSCVGGVCQGLRIAGCCVTDADCADAVACTEDRCVDHGCVHVPMDDRCGSAPECGNAVCLPSQSTETSGCVVVPAGDGAYCTEDQNPCTADTCRAGVCAHEPDGTGERCTMLAAPFSVALTALANTDDLHAAIAGAVGCESTSRTGCDVVPGADTARLLGLLGSIRMDLEAATLALGGRLIGSSAAAPGDPTVRARLALGLLGSTPGNLRSFLATLAQARARAEVRRGFARVRRAEGLRLLHGTMKLRRKLQRLLVRTNSFAR